MSRRLALHRTRLIERGVYRGRVEDACEIGPLEAVCPINQYAHSGAAASRPLIWDEPSQLRWWLIDEELLTCGVLLVVERELNQVRSKGRWDWSHASELEGRHPMRGNHEGSVHARVRELTPSEGGCLQSLADKCEQRPSVVGPSRRMQSQQPRRSIEQEA